VQPLLWDPRQLGAKAKERGKEATRNAGILCWKELADAPIASWRMKQRDQMTRVLTEPLRGDPQATASGVHSVGSPELTVGNRPRALTKHQWIYQTEGGVARTERECCKGGG